MRAIIEVEVPDHQIGQEVSIYFMDTMMIKGIVQEPSDDLISRQAVLNEFYDVENLYERIKQLPSVTPQEPKTGHWISSGVQGEVDGQIVQTFTCSECDAISIFRMASGNIVNGDLCPNCGCRMVETQESEVEE